MDRRSLQRCSLSPYPLQRYILCSGRLRALTDQWGNIELVTTEGGYQRLSPNCARFISGVHSLLQTENGVYSIHYNDVEIEKSIIYTTGYAILSAKTIIDDQNLSIEHRYCFFPDAKSVIHYGIALKNHGAMETRGRIVVCSDLFLTAQFGFYDDLSGISGYCSGPRYAAFRDMNEHIGSFFLIAPKAAEPGRSQFSRELSLPVILPVGESLTIKAAPGHNEYPDYIEIISYVIGADWPGARSQWATSLQKLVLPHADQKMKDEACWCYGQMLSFLSYDSSVNEHYFSIGGYGWALTLRRENCEHLLFSYKTKGLGTHKATLAMTFKLLQETQKTWRRIVNWQQLELVQPGGVFENGALVEDSAA